MKLIKIDKYNYTVDKEYIIPNNFELKCVLAPKEFSEGLPSVYEEVDKALLTDKIHRADYCFKNEYIYNIYFTLNDVMVDIYINWKSGEVNVKFDYVPKQLDITELESNVEMFLEKILKPNNKYQFCKSPKCKYYQAYKVSGGCFYNWSPFNYPKEPFKD